MELAYQLKIDMRKRMEEIKELDNEVKHRNVVVKKLERDKEEMVGYKSMHALMTIIASYICLGTRVQEARKR